MRRTCVLRFGQQGPPQPAANTLKVTELSMWGGGAKIHDVTLGSFGSLGAWFSQFSVILVLGSLVVLSVLSSWFSQL